MVFNDLIYSTRILFKKPLTTGVCMLTFALGIGANIVVFSILNAFLLQPLPFPQFNRLFAVPQIDVQEGGRSYISMPDFLSFEGGVDNFKIFRLSI